MDGTLLNKEKRFLTEQMKLWLKLK